MLIIYDFCMLFCDDSVEVRVYDLNPSVEAEVFHGTMSELMTDDLSDYEVESCDLDFATQYFCINIDTSEDC